MEILPSVWQQALSFLSQGGPLAVAIVIGWAYVRKDKECKESYAALNALSSAQVTAMVQLEATVKALKDVLLLQLQSRTNHGQGTNNEDRG